MAIASPAFAQLASTEISLSSSAGKNKAILILAATDVAEAAGSPEVDYAVFATELAAYLTKEIVPDSANEFDGSLLGSHLSPSMPESHSTFGKNCLTIVTRIGSALPLSAPALGSRSVLDYAVRAIGTGLALRQIWSAFQNDVEGNRSGISLKPKVSARRVGLNLTVHW